MMKHRHNWPSILISIILMGIGVYWIWMAANVPANRPNYIADPRGLRSFMFGIGGVIAIAAALLNLLGLRLTRLKNTTISRIFSVINIGGGLVGLAFFVFVLPAILGVGLLYNGISGWLRASTTPAFSGKQR